jgi:outer membrane immunogenic protein
MSKSKLPALGVSLLSLAAISLATPSVAADLWGPEGHGSIKDAPLATGFNWTGIYAGVHAGLATGDRSSELQGIPLKTDYDIDGALYGGHLGYNHQFGRWVLGVEGTYSGSDIDGKSGCVAGLFDCRTDIDWLATLEGRIGYSFGRSLLYARGGVAWGDVNTSADLLGLGFLTLDGSETHTGWTAGAGFEHALSDRVIARIEYSHVDLGSETHDLGVNFLGTPIPGVAIPTDVDAEIDTIKIGVSVKLGG